jgi:hypothetical protein
MKITFCINIALMMPLSERLYQEIITGEVITPTYNVFQNYVKL